MAKYSCVKCGCLYEGDAVPEGFKCILCGAEGSSFIMREKIESNGCICGVRDERAKNNGKTLSSAVRSILTLFHSGIFGLR